MKRTGRILCLAMILVIMATAVCFAGTEGGLKLTGTYPEDGYKGAATENMSVKLYFDGQLTEEVLGDKNADAIKIMDPDGKALPTRVLYAPKEEGVVLVIVDTDEEGKTIKGKSNAEYTVKVSGSMVDNEGNTLGQDYTFKYKTLNEGTNNTVSMVMMFVMMGGMMVMTTKSAAKEAQKQAEAMREKESKVNPYKEAKKTGKSVEEIVEQDKKDKAKKAEKAAKKAAKEAEEDYDFDFDFDFEEEGVYKVKSPRPIAAAGGKYITGRKAEAEAKAAAEAARKEQEAKWAANAKKGKGKKKK